MIPASSGCLVEPDLASGALQLLTTAVLDNKKTRRVSLLELD